MNRSDEDNEEFREIFLKKNNDQENPSHYLMFINEESISGKNVPIGLFSRISRVIFWDKNDIAHFFSNIAADFHKICICPIKEIERRLSIIENDLFICFFYRFMTTFAFKNLQILFIRFSNRNYRCGVRTES